MKKLFKIGISFLKLLFSNRPKVYWWSMRYEKKSNLENFGDFLTPYIVEKLTGKQPVLFSTKSKFAKLFKHSLMIGSIISRSRKSTLVWGSGIIKKDEVIEGGNFLAVRGPYTADRIKQLGFKTTDKFGDPALLLPSLYNPKIETKYKIGIIPHFFHFDELYFQNNNSDILFINLLTENVEDVIDQILSCEKIISTSLHGVIVSHAYQIPALWWKYGKLNGDDIKFYDYFASVNLDIKKNHNEKLFNDIILCEDYYLPNQADLNKIKKDLIETYPYKLKKTIQS
jgi:pyruvyltransferase